MTSEPLKPWKTVSVCGFDELMAALDRADRKSYLPDAMAEEWAEFLWCEPAQAAEAGEALTRLIDVGAELSNCAFNLAQRDNLEERERNVLDACRRKWDAANAKYRAALKGDSQGVESR